MVTVPPTRLFSLVPINPLDDITIVFKRELVPMVLLKRLGVGRKRRCGNQHCTAGFRIDQRSEKLADEFNANWSVRTVLLDFY